MTVNLENKLENWRNYHICISKEQAAAKVRELPTYWVKIFSVVEDGLQVVGSASRLRTAALAFLKRNINQK
jgi:hypothetical protein